MLGVVVQRVVVVSPGPVVVVIQKPSVGGVPGQEGGEAAITWGSRPSEDTLMPCGPDREAWGANEKEGRDAPTGTTGPPSVEAPSARHPASGD